jgi:hypothetical protein
VKKSQQPVAYGRGSEPNRDREGVGACADFFTPSHTHCTGALNFALGPLNQTDLREIAVSLAPLA